jgi:putative DNA primase/helicase
MTAAMASLGPIDGMACSEDRPAEPAEVAAFSAFDGATDFNDLARLRRPDAIEQAMATANPGAIPEGRPQTSSATAVDLASRLAALAAMPALEYDRVRESAAGELGVRVSTLDAEVDKKRAEVRIDTGAGQPLQFAKLEPWPEPVDGAALLAELADSAARHLVLPKHAEIGLALWVVFTYTIDAADAAPILAIVSPEKRCGKSTLLDWLTRLVRNALAAANVSPAPCSGLSRSGNRHC